MTIDLMGQMNAAGSSSYKNIQYLNAINISLFQKLAELQFQFTNLSIEGSVKQAKLFSEVSNYKDFWAVETELASRYGAKFVGLGREATQVIMESRDELVNWVGQSFKDVQQNPDEVSESKPVKKKTRAVTRKRSTRKKTA